MYACSLVRMFSLIQGYENSFERLLYVSSMITPFSYFLKNVVNIDYGLVADGGKNTLLTACF